MSEFEVQNAGWHFWGPNFKNLRGGRDAPDPPNSARYWNQQRLRYEAGSVPELVKNSLLIMSKEINDYMKNLKAVNNTFIVVYSSGKGYPLARMQCLACVTILSNSAIIASQSC